MAFSISSLLFASCLLVAVAAPAMVDAQFQFTNSVFINGTVLCSVNAGADVAALPFPNARVDVICGRSTSIGAAVTNALGGFTIIVPRIRLFLASLPSGCRVVVTTPLINCNPILPASGVLATNTLTFGSSIFGSMTAPNAIYIPPQSFQFYPY